LVNVTAATRSFPQLSRYDVLVLAAARELRARLIGGRLLIEKDSIEQLAGDPSRVSDLLGRVR
jgi:hypothetical protein